MNRALQLAALARGRTSPNPMVGAVVVRNGEVVGEGYHRRAGTEHAEVRALREAGKHALGASLYVNLEPCAHRGRTPPCTEAIQGAGIREVFAAIRDPNPLVNGRGSAHLRRGGIQVRFGLAAAEARRLNESYLKYIRTGLPFVLLKSAVSIDGKIATRTGDSRWVTSSESRARVHQMRDSVDAVLVGIGTVLADDPLLNTRLPGGRGKDPLRIIVDPDLRIPLTAKLLAARLSSRTVVVAGRKAAREKVSRLRSRGAEVLMIKGRGRRIDFLGLMKELGGMGVTSVMIEGGSEVAASALAAGVVDKVVTFIAPKIVGGRKAPTSVGGDGVELMSDAMALRSVSWSRIGDDLVVEGYLREEEK